MAKQNTCAWCYKPTTMPETFAPISPILDWMEEKIDKWCEDNDYTREEVWGIDSDWNKIDLPEQFENELLAYDELIASVERKVICQECLVEDDKLWKKYYYDPLDDEDWDGEFETDIEIDEDDLD